MPLSDPSTPSFIAFRNGHRIATGDAASIVRGIFAEGGDRAQGAVLVFDDRTSAPLELDLRGTEREALDRLADRVRPDGDAARTGSATTGAGQPSAARRGPGRPRLGVVSREVTLLPRHWDWLGRQPGGASAALRRLVEQARSSPSATARDTRRAAQESAYRFISAMLGDQPGFEAATRALFAHDQPGFDAATAPWPADLRDHARHLASLAFAAA